MATDWIIDLGHWSWLIAGIVLVIVEVFAPGAIFLWIGISAGLVGVIAWIFPGLSWETEALLFAGLSVLSIAFSRIYLRRRPIATDEPTLNRRGESYIGRLFTLKEPIVNRRGRIHVDDTMWRIEGQDLPAGTTVIVTAADGIVLKVEAADDIQATSKAP